MLKFQDNTNNKHNTQIQLYASKNNFISFHWNYHRMWFIETNNRYYQKAGGMEIFQTNPKRKQ